MVGAQRSQTRKNWGDGILGIGGGLTPGNLPLGLLCYCVEFGSSAMPTGVGSLSENFAHVGDRIWWPNLNIFSCDQYRPTPKISLKSVHKLYSTQTNKRINQRINDHIMLQRCWEY